jgi:hypothetical protein
MSWQTKAWLGPGKTVTCDNCGAKLSVSWSCMALMSPMLAGWVGLRTVGYTNASMLAALLSVPVSLLLMACCWTRVPLVPR